MTLYTFYYSHFPLRIFLEIYGFGERTEANFCLTTLWLGIVTDLGLA